MALSSMTGFARVHGTSGLYAWAWELKSVNAKGFDLRLRTPSGWDAIDAPVRAQAAEALARGTVYGNLTVERQGVAPTVKINENVLNAVLSAIDGLKGRVGAAPSSIEGILGLKGVMEVSEQEESADERAAAEKAVIGGFATALNALLAARREEGAALNNTLSRRLHEIETLTTKADAAPGRQPDASKARLAEQVAALMEAGSRFDADRLHQEAVLLASKADIREELDRLRMHVAQAQKLIAAGGPAGRRLDFLSQELNRESNTLCAKANDIELTNIGLELKSVVEQFREQVQNLE
jgi:uncharacterized protein (TIGR00255 family)